MFTGLCNLPSNLLPVVRCPSCGPVQQAGFPSTHLFQSLCSEQWGTQQLKLGFHLAEGTPGSLDKELDMVWDVV